MREKLVSGLIRSYNWTDARDMVADGLTKGSVDRTALSAIVDGEHTLCHAVHEYKEPAASTTVASISELFACGGGGPIRDLDRRRDRRGEWHNRPPVRYERLL